MTIPRLAVAAAAGCDDCRARGHYCPATVTADSGSTRLCFACDDGSICEHDKKAAAKAKANGAADVKDAPLRVPIASRAEVLMEQHAKQTGAASLAVAKALKTGEAKPAGPRRRRGPYNTKPGRWQPGGLRDLAPSAAPAIPVDADEAYRYALAALRRERAQVLATLWNLDQAVECLETLLGTPGRTAPATKPISAAPGGAEAHG